MINFGKCSIYLAGTTLVSIDIRRWKSFPFSASVSSLNVFLLCFSSIPNSSKIAIVSLVLFVIGRLTSLKYDRATNSGLVFLP